MKKPSPPISQDYENQNKLVLHKEQSNISFDNNNFFESLNLGRVESKNFSNIFMDPDNKNDNIHYPGISFFLYFLINILNYSRV